MFYFAQLAKHIQIKSEHKHQKSFRTTNDFLLLILLYFSVMYPKLLLYSGLGSTQKVTQKETDWVSYFSAVICFRQMIIYYHELFYHGSTSGGFVINLHFRHSGVNISHPDCSCKKTPHKGCKSFRLLKIVKKNNMCFWHQSPHKSSITQRKRKQICH